MTLHIILAIIGFISLPVIFLTLYLKTEKGTAVKLGSFFLIKDFPSRIFRVRSLKDRLLLILRLVFAVIMAVLIYDPLKLDTPARESLLHRSREIAADTLGENNKIKVSLNVPNKVLDSFDEDIFFLESLTKSLNPGSADLTIIYDPDIDRLKSIPGDIVVFPSISQSKEVFNRWSNIFYITDLMSVDSRIKGYGHSVKKYFRAVIVDKEKVSIYSVLENDAPLSFAFKDNLNNGRLVLLFTTGAASYWGEAGLSGICLDTISAFRKNISFADQKNGDANIVKEAGNADSKLPVKALLYAALLFMIFELLYFIFRAVKIKKGKAVSLLIIFFTLLNSNLQAEKFAFIELDNDTVPNNSNKLMFSIIKNEVERRTSVEIDRVFYRKISASGLADGKMPELPFLWIIGCKQPGFFSKNVKEALGNFIDRGGIIFIDTCGKQGDSKYLSEVYNFVVEKFGYDPGKGFIPALPRDHPVYKSFFLLPPWEFMGIDISKSTKRTAIIATRISLKNGILKKEKNAVYTGVNLILYMLSGNYKSDQLHTRQIMEKLKKRELYR